MFGVRLRPVRMEDAEFIVWLRNLEHVRGKIGDSAGDVRGQEHWLESYFKREGDYYFIIETLNGIPLGTHSLYDIKDGSAELGRWIIRPGVQAAVPSHMGAFSIGFDQLGLNVLHNRMVSTNAPVISISRRFGFDQVSCERGGRMIGGQAVDMVHYILTSEKWALTRPKLLPLAKIAEGLVQQWAAAQADPFLAPAPGPEFRQQSAC